MIDRVQLKDLYWNKQLSISQVAKEIGYSPRNVRYWMKKYGIARRTRGQGISLRYNKPAFSPSVTLAYILGVMLGDGCAYRKKRIGMVILHVKDKLFAQKFRDFLGEIGLSSKIYIRKGIYRTYACSTIFVDWYKKLTLKDIERLVSPLKSMVIAFICGFYESDGSYVVSKKYRSRAIQMSNGKKEILDLVYDLLRELSFNPKLYGPYNYVRSKYGRSVEYRICIHGKEVKRFLNMVKPCIKCGEVRRHKNPRTTC